MTPLDRARLRRQALLRIRQRRLACDLRVLMATLAFVHASPPAVPPGGRNSPARGISPAPALSHSREVAP